MSDGGPARPVDPPDGGRPGRRLAQLAALDVEVLKGVGPAVARSLEALGITSVLDLLTHYPRRYVDATRRAPVADLAEGERVTVLGEVVRVTQASPSYGRGRGRGRRPPGRVEVVVSDGADRLRVVFFNQAWRARQLPAGTTALFFGTVSRYRDALQMVNPVVDVLAKPGDAEAADDAADRPRVFPVYPLSEKADLTSVALTRLVDEALDRAGPMADPVDPGWLDRFSLVDRSTAFVDIHRPRAVDATEPARRRLAFDELLRLQLALVLRQARLQADARGMSHVVARADGAPTLAERFLADLPFPLTGAQRRAVDEITGDLATSLPMHRLLQGDVGAGKTVVATAAMLVAVEGGHQAALMAPTEVLAEQHAAEIRRLVGDLSVPDPTTLAGTRPLRVGLLTNRTGAAERGSLRDGLLTGPGGPGAVDLLVGTHALLVDDVAFRSLGVVVIDEQHRFGVEQRAALRDKGRGPDGTGRDPDLLVMTATPIPRTAAMVVFGDLDMTVVDELPPGRQPVATTWLRGDAAAVAWDRVREQVAAGRRAFVVCPLVEGSERVEARSATAEAERLAAHELDGLAVGLLHGQMRPADKEATMAAFRSGDLDVLVATTVIEVGVDVPAASVMVVEDADRFGIAQLHQLRGRVGRGGDPAWCYLLSDADTPEAETRLTAMEATTDGFELADVDLRLRGEGTILGARQKGRSDLKAARLGDDRDLVDDARTLAEALVGADPSLADHPLLVDELEAVVDPEEREFLFKS